MRIKLTAGWFPVPDDVCRDLGITEGTEAELETFEGGVMILTLIPHTGVTKPTDVITAAKSKTPR